jgi:hypothetical protein
MRVPVSAASRRRRSHPRGLHALRRYTVSQLCVANRTLRRPAADRVLG